MEDKWNYRSSVSILIHQIFIASLSSDQKFTTHAAIAKELGITNSQLSRVYTCTCSLSAEKFYRLIQIARAYIGDENTFKILCVSHLSQ